MTAEVARVTAEIQAAMTVAQRFPRDEVRCIDRIRMACQRPGLAMKAEYSYPRGKKQVTGPSIHLANAMAAAWGNMDVGFRILHDTPPSDGRPGSSTVEVFAHDLETNYKARRTITVPHVRERSEGNKPLTDPRDVYELVANMAARRVRACILQVLPGDVVDEAVAVCRQTVETKFQPNEDNIKKLIATFGEMGVTIKQIEERFGRRIDAITAQQFLDLRSIYTSIHDGMSTPSDWFKSADDADTQPSAADAAKQALRQRQQAPQADTPPEPDKPRRGKQTTPPEPTPADINGAAGLLRDAGSPDPAPSAAARPAPPADRLATVQQLQQVVQRVINDDRAKRR